MEPLIALGAAAAVLVLAVSAATGGRPRLLIRSDRGIWALLRQNREPLVGSAAAVLLTAVFVYLFYFPPSADIGAEQPIPFSHRVHSGVKAIACEFCHPYVGDSIHPGLPPVEKCLFCHDYIIAAHPWIQKEHRYFDTRTPTPWVKVNYLAEHVVFNHQRHIRKNFQCGQCHGPVETMDRIKGEHFYMGFCIECHERNRANLDCWLACHN